jgi:hypothetical protein
MNKKIHAFRGATLALVLGACGISDRTKTDLPTGPVPDAGGPQVLYARDGSVVQGNGPAGAPRSGPAAERLPQEGSRTFMLELYQKAIDEKEALALEIRNLEATLEKSRSELAAALKEKDELQKKHDALEAERARLQEESFDLSGRLVTAQIRRLEAEKILLESKIEWQRLEEKSAGEKPKAAADHDEAPTKTGTETRKP